MQHATAHHTFRAAMKFITYVDRAATTNLTFSKILSFDGLANLCWNGFDVVLKVILVIFIYGTF